MLTTGGFVECTADNLWSRTADCGRRMLPQVPCGITRMVVILQRQMGIGVDGVSTPSRQYSDLPHRHRCRVAPIIKVDSAYRRRHLPHH